MGERCVQRLRYKLHAWRRRNDTGDPRKSVVDHGTDNKEYTTSVQDPHRVLEHNTVAAVQKRLMGAGKKREGESTPIELLTMNGFCDPKEL